MQNFPPEVDKIKIKTLKRTTNNCECSQAKFDNLFTSTHVHIAVFIESVLAMQTDYTNELYQ